MRLYQHWLLGGYDWYWPLVKLLDKANAELDPFRKDRVRGTEDLFGETPILTIFRLLEIAEAVLQEKPRLWVDLGCGRGVSCLTAASVGVASVGFEKEMSWVQSASCVAEKMSLPATFESGDFLLKEWPSPALVFVVATAFPQVMREEIALRLLRQPAPTAVMTADWELGEYGFQQRWEGRLPVDWGTANFSLWTPSEAVAKAR